MKLRSGQDKLEEKLLYIEEESYKAWEDIVAQVEAINKTLQVINFIPLDCEVIHSKNDLDRTD